MNRWQRMALEIYPPFIPAPSAEKIREAIAEALEDAWIDGHKDGLRDRRDFEPVPERK